MKIKLKRIKYENNIFFIKNSQYTHFHVYFAQKTKKDMLYSARNLLDNNNIKLILYNKQWPSILPIQNQIPWNLYSMSSNLFIGFQFLKKKITNETISKIHALQTKPLILISSILPKQIFTINRFTNPLIPIKPDDFFSQLLINNYMAKIYIFNTSVFSWLDLQNN